MHSISTNMAVPRRSVPEEFYYIDRKHERLIKFVGELISTTNSNPLGNEFAVAKLAQDQLQKLGTVKLG